MNSLDLSKVLLTALMGKEFNARIDLVSKSEKYLANLCDSRDDKNAVILRLSQGLGGHTGEDDFESTITINGKDVKLNDPSGLIWGDVKYCGPLPISIKAKGVEADVFFDDHYLQSGSDLKLSGESIQSGTIRLKRSSYTGWTGKDHDIKVEVIRPATLANDRVVAKEKNLHN